MSDRNNDMFNNNIEILPIEPTDTITRFMEKCNNNFSKLLEHGGGTEGAQGEQGAQGLPTKPKVPIHVWRKGVEFEYGDESSTSDGGFEITNIYENLENEKYQSGHLILLQNGHVYILEPMVIGGFDLEPKFLLALQSYDPQTIIDGKSAYMHIAYADNVYGDNMITDQQLRNENTETEPIATFGLRRSSVATTSIDINEKPYMGIYSDFEETSSTQPYRYTWVRIQGQVGPVGETGSQGVQGPQGPKGDRGDAFTGQQYTIDLEGDMSTISLDVDRTRLYDESGDYCKCTLHAYYGKESVGLNIDDITIGYPDDYIEKNGIIVLKSDYEKKLGKIEKSQFGNGVIIKFIPDETFIFPQKYIVFPISISTKINDNNDNKTYEFYRETKWSIQGIVSPFELEIIPQHRVIKLDKSGYNPSRLKAYVYKIEDGKRELFNFNDNIDFHFEYKDINISEWIDYPGEDGVSTDGISCLEFRVVRYIDPESSDSELVEEIWDYEDVWVIADGRDTHYYHADLGNAESILVLTTGKKINYGSASEPIYCAEFKDESEYSITFNPKFYDGSKEINDNISVNVNCENEFGESFKYNFANNTLTITRVPYGIKIIPMTFSVSAEDNGEIKYDTISFNVYISTLSDLYTLETSPTTFNTSTGKDGETIECFAFKNTNPIQPTKDELNKFALSLKYVIYNESGNKINGDYETPLKYGSEFVASDVAIDFILSYQGDEIAKSTVPLIKNGKDGKDGDAWQYIFCKSPKYPFSETGISNPAEWDDNGFYNPDNELIIEPWTDNPQGVDSIYKYEYQSYRKWDKKNKKWGNYLPPTLYSNYSESGSGYSVILSNSVAVIPVGDDWSVNENNRNQSDSTLVYLYNNTSDMSNFDSVTISIPDEYKTHFSIGKEGDINKVIFNPIADDGSLFDFGSNTYFKLPITVTYKSGDSDFDDFISTINWTLTPIKGLEDVEVFVDKRVVNTTMSKNHSFRVGYYLISTNGDKTFISDRITGNTKGYDIILTDNIENLLDENIVNDWENADYKFTYDNGVNKDCYVILVNKENNIYNIIDYINITSVNDGVTAVHLELSQDYIALPCDNYGNIHFSYTKNISFKMSLYNGDTPINDDNITYIFKNGNNDITEYFGKKDTNVFEISNENINNIVNGNTNIECTAKYNNIYYHKTLYIELTETPYELELNKNILIRDANLGTNGQITDVSLIASVKYWDNTTGEWVYTNKGSLKLKDGDYTYDFDTNEKDYIYYKRTLTIADSILQNTTSSELRISYYNDNTTDELTYEIIGIINSGKDGNTPNPPHCTSVNIIGYSLNESITITSGFNGDNENYSNKWFKSLDKLGVITSRAKIYMLNEFTWSVGEPTYSITITLAGTQGDNGKSRVLFYLGSFKDGTLSLNEDGVGAVIGYLTDDRCDYYIDKNDTAWMRTGVDETAEGSSEGNNGNSSWKESEKIGFLQAGAIHANMINAGTISSNIALVEEIQSLSIAADIIEGKTIKSNKLITPDDENSDATWQINNNGDGWLANKNIEWDKNGDLTINGTINGLIGGTSESVTINGDLVINNTVNVLDNNNNPTNEKTIKTSLVLCGDHLYEDPLNNDTKDKYITLSNGLCDKLYHWTFSNDSIANTIDDGGDNGYDDSYIPNDIYTKSNYRNSNNSLTVSELYLKNNNKYFLFNTYDYALAFPTPYGDRGYDNEDDSGGYINVIIGGIRYTYTYKEVITLTSVDDMIDIANTRLFSDGQFYTNSIFASDGQYYGKIYSKGEFSGKLIDVNGLIHDSEIYRTTISESNIGLSHISNSRITESDIELWGDNHIAVYGSNSHKIFEISTGDNSYTPPLKYTTKKQSYTDTNYTFSKKYIDVLKVLKSDIYYKPGQNISLSKLKINLQAYAPNKIWTDQDDAKNIKTVVELYWRYKDVNKNDGLQYNKICQFGGNLDGSFSKIHYKFDSDGEYDNAWNTKYSWESKWNTTGGGQQVTDEPDTIKLGDPTYFTESAKIPDKEGYIEIVAIINCTLPAAEQGSYPKITVTFNSFDINLSDVGKPIDINTTIINNSGIHITGKLDSNAGTDDRPPYITTTESGYIYLSSGDGNYQIRIGKNSIEIRRGSNSSWTSL